MSLLSGVVIFFRSIVVLTEDEQFLDCATTAFVERCVGCIANGWEPQNCF